MRYNTPTLGWRNPSFKYCVTGSKTGTRSHGVFTSNLGSKYWYFYGVTDEETKAQRGQEAGLGSHSSEASGRALNSGWVMLMWGILLLFQPGLPHSFISASWVSISGSLMNLKSKHVRISQPSTGSWVFPCPMADFLYLEEGIFLFWGMLSPDFWKRYDTTVWTISKWPSLTSPTRLTPGEAGTIPEEERHPLSHFVRHMSLRVNYFSWRQSLFNSPKPESVTCESAWRVAVLKIKYVAFAEWTRPFSFFNLRFKKCFHAVIPGGWGRLFVLSQGLQEIWPRPPTGN